MFSNYQMVQLNQRETYIENEKKTNSWEDFSTTSQEGGRNISLPPPLIIFWSAQVPGGKTGQNRSHKMQQCMASSKNVAIYASSKNVAIYGLLKNINWRASSESDFIQNYQHRKAMLIEQPRTEIPYPIQSNPIPLIALKQERPMM